jgi:hypothetical protein
MSETTTNDAELAEIRRRVFYDDPNHDRDPRGDEDDPPIPIPQEYADRVALLAEVDRLRALLAAGTPQPTDANAIRREMADAIRAKLKAHRATLSDLKLDDEAGGICDAINIVRETERDLAFAALDRRAVVPPPPEPTSCPHMATGMCSTCWGDDVPPLVGLPVPPPPDTAAARTTDAALRENADYVRGLTKLREIATHLPERWRESLFEAVGQMERGAVAFERRTCDVLRAPAPATDDAPTARENDIRRVADFIVGWWPGLEDGLCWGDDDALDNHPVRLAARRLLGRGPSAPAGPPQEASHE